jgi:autotransporter-associated beta strand protein
VLNYNAPQNTYIGNGTLQISNNGSGSVSIGTDGGTNPTVFAMTGGLITIDSGVTFVNGGWSKGIWTHNKADMRVNGTLDVSNGNPVIVNSLNGAGAIVLSDVSSSRATELHVGVLGGSGTFSGTIQEPHPAGSFVRIVKQGAGTQTFDNLANQKAGEIVINAGGVALLQDSDVTSAASIAGAGSLTKSGAGVLTLTGRITLTGPLTISEGALSIGTNLSSTANVVIATGAILDLNFAGQLTLNSLGVGGSSPLPPGIYSSSHGTYGSYFTGAGTLLISGTGYDVWAGTNSVFVGTPEGDPDGDGIKNLLEYVLGGDPLKSSTDALPKASIEGTDLVLTYKRSDESETDTVQTGQWSTDLQTWSDVDVAVELVSENDSAPDDMKIHSPLSKSLNGRHFGRLQVTKP